MTNAPTQLPQRLPGLHVEWVSSSPCLISIASIHPTHGYNPRTNVEELALAPFRGRDRTDN